MKNFFKLLCAKSKTVFGKRNFMYNHKFHQCVTDRFFYFLCFQLKLLFFLLDLLLVWFFVLSSLMLLFSHVPCLSSLVYYYYYYYAFLHTHCLLWIEEKYFPRCLLSQTYCYDMSFAFFTVSNWTTLADTDLVF